MDESRPIFQQIAEQIENDIIAGLLPEETQVPSTNEFAEVSDGRSWRFRQDTLVAFYVVTLTGLAGIAMLARDRRGARVDLILATGAIVAQFVVISILLVAPPRLRAPFDVAMCAGAGLLYARVADRRASG